MSNSNNVLALDCEMVEGYGCIIMVARVSVVDESGAVVYDTYVKPSKKVIDYRTSVSGIRPEHLVSGKPLDKVKTEVAGLIKSHILVGHDVVKDLRGLMLCHPKWNIRDSAEYPPFQTDGGQPRSLKYLAKEYLNLSIQDGPHSSIEDAKVAMLLYKKEKNDWNEWIAKHVPKSGSGKKSKKYKVPSNLF